MLSLTLIIIKGITFYKKDYYLQHFFFKQQQQQKQFSLAKIFLKNIQCPQENLKKYARSTSPSRLQQNDDPSPSKEQSDFNFLIGALTNRILEKGLMDNKFLKNFFLNRDELKKAKEEQRNIVERKLIQCLRFPKKIQNQATIRLIEEFAKEKGFTIENSIKYQQYEILNKPIIFQPTVFVTKDRNWFDIFEQFKSENLKIVPNQNLQEFNNLINNQQFTTWEKLQKILKQRFMIHNANDFPSVNPVIGNEEEEGNLQFLIDENLIPHRIIFKNKDEYDLLNWYLENKNKNELNILTQNWSNYIQNIQKLRDKQPEVQDRKIIQLNTQMQVEQEAKTTQSQVQIQIDSQQQSQINSKQSSQVQQQQIKQSQQNQQSKPNQTPQQSSQQTIVSQKQQQQLKLKQDQKQNQIDNKVKELISQNEQLQNQLNDQDKEKINQMSLDELAEQVLHGLGIVQDPNIFNTQLQSSEKMLITIQFPLEVKNKQQIKILITNFDKELEQGFIYLNEQEILKLDQEIQQSLQLINFKERKIQLKNQEFTLTSPFCVQTSLMPLNMARQWQYFKNHQSVQVYIIQAQIFWLFQQLYLDNSHKQLANAYVQHTYQSYVDKWSNLINTNSSLWKKTTEEALNQRAQNLCGDLIYKSDDKEVAHYNLKIIEDVWFTFSCLKQFILINTVYDVKQTILIYFNLKGEFYEPNLTVKDLLIGMKGYCKGIQILPIFEPTFTHDVVCWLCYNLFESWEKLYIHKCINSQAKSSFKQDHLQAWKLFKSK